MASDLSDRLGTRLVVVHVLAPDESPTTHVELQREQDATRFLERLTGEIGADLTGVARLEVGEPAERLAASAVAEQAEMIVVGSRGRGALEAAVLGSVSSELATRSPRPVLVVPPGAAAEEPPHHRHPRGPAGSVVCGVDGSDRALAAARLAADLADRLGLRLVVAHAYRAQSAWRSHADTLDDQPWLLDEQRRLGGELLERSLARLGARESIDVRLEHGHSAEALARVASSEAAELLVVGSRGRGRIETALLGSTSALLASSAPTPVMVVTTLSLEPHGPESLPGPTLRRCSG